MAGQYVIQEPNPPLLCASAGWCLSAVFVRLAGGWLSHVQADAAGCFVFAQYFGLLLHHRLCVTEAVQSFLPAFCCFRPAALVWACRGRLGRSPAAGCCRPYRCTFFSLHSGGLSCASCTSFIAPTLFVRAFSRHFFLVIDGTARTARWHDEIMPS